MKKSKIQFDLETDTSDAQRLLDMFKEENIPKDYMNLLDTHVDSDKYLYPSDKSPVPTNEQKQNLRNKRKKKTKKTHRKKK